VLDLSATMFYNAPSLNVPPVVLFSILNAPVSPATFSPILIGKFAWNSAEFHDYSDSGPFELRNFHRNLIFFIVKCVPANLEHVSTGLESFPAINSSDFMNQKTFLLSSSLGNAKKYR
jgi:hypothetical protein